VTAEVYARWIQPDDSGAADATLDFPGTLQASRLSPWPNLAKRSQLFEGEPLQVCDLGFYRGADGI
jgi:hypothetical protein